MVVDPVGMKSFNGNILALRPVLVLARLASAEPAMELGLLFEGVGFDWRFLLNLSVMLDVTALISTWLKWGDCLQNMLFL